LISTLAGDMAAVLSVLETLPSIDAGRLGLFGVSQANWYMPLVAETHPAVGFMAVLGGGVVSVGLNNHYEALTSYDPANIAIAEAALADFDGQHGFDPAPHVRELEVPMLYLLGSLDANGPPHVNAQAIRDMSDDGVPIEVVVYDGAGHLLEEQDFWRDVEPWLDEALR